MNTTLEKCPVKISEKIALRVADLVALAVRYSVPLEGHPQLFVDFCGHVGTLNVRSYADGWKKGEEERGRTWDDYVYLTDADSAEAVERVYLRACEFFGVDAAPKP